MDQTLADLIEHRSWISADATLAVASNAFKQHEWEFMAVLDQGEFLGLCSRSDIADALGSRYGFSLNQSKQVSTFLRREALQLMADVSLNYAFEQVFSRDLDYFYDDVVVLDHGGLFRGLIRTHALIRLQHHIHRESISLLTRQSQEIQNRNLQMLEDLELCSQMQRALFPAGLANEFWPLSDCPELVPLVSHFYHPNAVVGGDFFYWRRWSPQSIGVLVADVMGHDLRAALMTTMMRALFEEIALKDRDPGAVLSDMNQRLLEMVGARSNDLVYVTACYVLIDLCSGVVSLASAAHPMPLMIPSSDAGPFFLDDQSRGTVLGIFDEAVYPSLTFKMRAGDRLFLFTDGIYEIKNSRGDFWGVEGLFAEAQSAAKLDNQSFLTRIVDKARTYLGDQSFSDDVCLVSIEASGAGRTGYD